VVVWNPSTISGLAADDKSAVASRLQTFERSAIVAYRPSPTFEWTRSPLSAIGCLATRGSSRSGAARAATGANFEAA
jgi:hypothetical protein